MTACTAGAVSLVGCGGSQTASVRPDAMPLTPPTGMTVSSATPVHARSERDTIATLLPDSEHRFAPVSARSRTDGFHVTSIARDGSNGFMVTYVIAGEERTVHFESSDYGTPRYQYDYYTQTEDGAEFWLNSPFCSFSTESKNEGSTRFQYLDIYGSGVNSGDTHNRLLVAFGARTDADSLPVGAATYVGTFYAEDHSAEYANLDDRS